MTAICHTVTLSGFIPLAEGASTAPGRLQELGGQDTSRGRGNISMSRSLTSQVDIYVLKTGCQNWPL